MLSRLQKLSWTAGLLGAFTTSAAWSQSPTSTPTNLIQPVSGVRNLGSQPSCAPVQPGCPTPTIPGMTPDMTQPSDTAATPSGPTGDTGARAGAFTGVAAPNVMGDLLFGSRSISFGFTRTAGNADFFGLASTQIVNSNVAENNSPLPEDRVSVRYNYFRNAQSVTGISPDTTLLTNVTAINSAGLPVAQPIFLQQAQTRSYDAHLYTFSVEQTFFQRMVSVELRLPFTTTLASHNTLSVGTPGGPVANAGGATTDSNGNPFFTTTVTPDQTLGHYDTEFGNITLILKGLFYENRNIGLYISGGTGILIPTGQDSRTTVIDFGSTGLDSLGNPTVQNSGERQRAITIENETWSLSPFVAFLATPTSRCFTQGFAGVEFPLDKSTVTYNDKFLIGNFPGDPTSVTLGSQAPPYSVRNSIQEQTLLHLDWSVGYWLLHKDNGRGLTGFAPMVELHYTSTLNNASVLQLPGNAAVTQINPANPATTINEVGPVVGSQRNRVDVLDLTLGTTFEFGRRATLAAGYVIPLRGGDNKTFDWEFLVQFNYYYGGR
jgi:hypothetical protein